MAAEQYPHRHDVVVRKNVLGPQYAAIAARLEEGDVLSIGDVTDIFHESFARFNTSDFIFFVQSGRFLAATDVPAVFTVLEPCEEYATVGLFFYNWDLRNDPLLQQEIEAKSHAFSGRGITKHAAQKLRNSQR